MAIVPLHKIPTKQEAENIIKQLALAGKISHSTHCKERMKERDITMPQVLNCLLKGKITEGPILSNRSNSGYEVCVEKVSAGDWLKVVVCIKFTERLLLITVIR